MAQQRMPDLQAFAFGFAVAAREAQYLPNLAAFAGNGPVLEAIQDLRTEVQGDLTGLRNQISGLQRSVLRLHHRSQNKWIGDKNARRLSMNISNVLRPLVNVDSGDEIANFPRTIGELLALDGIALDTIIGELGVNIPPGATLEFKQESIRREWAPSL